MLVLKLIHVSKKGHRYYEMYLYMHKTATYRTSATYIEHIMIRGISYKSCLMSTFWSKTILTNNALINVLSVDKFCSKDTDKGINWTFSFT